ncbi:hypothetical protein Acsp07_54120 [Actinomycetospora sp. NBRC 106378]|nr:hypothetical protein Acsp07_54120 [Actinomycetospora sp. NBRC 106378]
MAPVAPADAAVDVAAALAVTVSVRVAYTVDGGDVTKDVIVTGAGAGAVLATAATAGVPDGMRTETRKATAVTVKAAIQGQRRTGRRWRGMGAVIGSVMVVLARLSVEGRSLPSLALHRDDQEVRYELFGWPAKGRTDGMSDRRLPLGHATGVERMSP